MSHWDILLKMDLARVDFGGNPVSTPYAPLFDIQLDSKMAYVDKSIRGIANIKYNFDNGITLSSLTGVQNVSTENDLDANGGLTAPVSFRSQGNFFFYSQEFNLISPADRPFRWVLGLFGEKQLSHIPDYNKTGQEGWAIILAGPFPFLTFPFQETEYDAAVFGSAQYDLTPEITLEAGLRLSYNERHQFTAFTFGTGLTPPVIPFLEPAGGTHVPTSGDYADGKIALQWKPTDDDFAYVQAARGHTVKGINAIPNGTPPLFHDRYDPVEVWDYEAGWKRNWFDSQFRTQLDAYFENIGNYQAGFGTTSTPGSSQVVVRNAGGRSIIWGIEASGQANFGDLGFDFGAAYLHSKIGDFPATVNPFFGNPDAAPAISSNCFNASATLDLTGAKAPFSPEVTGNAGVQYAIHTGVDGWAVTPRADVAYTGDAQANLFACSLETIKARTLLNLQLRLDSDDSPWWGQFWMTNATDVHYVAAIQNVPTIYYAGPPRQFGFRIGRSF